MTPTDLVRASRDGDLFHYYWAARRALELLKPGTAMVAMTIEGASKEESILRTKKSDEIIDVAEYYGSENLREGGHVVYSQLKHSTAQVEVPWTLSGLEKTLEKFAAKYVELTMLGAAAKDSATFMFVSNRGVDPKVLDALSDVAEGRTPRNVAVAAKLRRCLNLNDPVLETEFCQRFRVDERAHSLLPMMRQFGSSVSKLLPEFDPDAATRLKEAVARRATSLDVSPITRSVVLTELGTPEDQYYPAPAQFIPPSHLINRDCYTAIAEEVLKASSPVIVHAPGGVGKSVFAQSIANFLPDGSAVVSYDCYGLGSYRRATGYRHAHRQGLVQVVNELATMSLCSPLLIGAGSDAAAYTRAFMSRVRHAANSAGSNLVVIAIDAADNAVMAAKEIDGGRSFVMDLLQESFPENVRLVAFCRTERIEYLKAPAGTPKFAMPSLEPEESRLRLERKYGAVSTNQALEFHRRTSGNPRVQDEVLDQADSVESCLSLLGEGFRSPTKAFDDLLSKKFDETLNAHGIDASKIESISRVLATLRPRIPIDVIAQLTDTSSAFVHSFVSDIGRPLLVQGDTVQFRDEPTESWFRSQFQAKGAHAKLLVQKLRVLATQDAYAAASLPQVLWESGELPELVALALTDDALPATNNIERREIEEHRVQFALRASLRTGNHFDAASLAFRAGGLAAGRSRHIALICANTDLAGEYLDSKTSEEIIASRTLRRSWPGSNMPYEGTIMAFNSSTQADSRNRLRSAEEWLVGWANRANRDPHDEEISDVDIAEIAVGRLVTEGPGACVKFFARIRSPHMAFKVGLLVSGRMIERGEIDKVNALLLAAKSNKYVQLAIARESMRHYVQLDRTPARQIATMLKRHKKKIDFVNRSDYEKDELSAICGALVAALASGYMEKERAGKILDLYLSKDPPRYLGQGSMASADPELRAWALRGYITGNELSIDQIADKELLDELSGKTHVSTREGQEFRTNIVPLLPWLSAWARMMCDPDAKPEAELQALAKSLPSGSRGADYSPNLHLNMAAKICASIIRTAPPTPSDAVLIAWMTGIADKIWTTTSYELIRLLASKPAWDDAIFALAQGAAGSADLGLEDMQFRVDNLLSLSRAIHAVSGEESRHYFAAALDIAEKLGDEAYSRWESTLVVAGKAGGDEPDDNRAFRLARMAEAFQPYLGDSFDIGAVITALNRLSARSALAITSRWRDRRFGDFNRSIGALVEPATGALGDNLNAAIAVSVFGNRIHDQQDLIEAATEQDPASRERLHKIHSELRRMKGLRTATDGTSEETNQIEEMSFTGSRNWFAPDSRIADELAKNREKLKSLNFTLSEDLHAARSMRHGHSEVGIDTILCVAFDGPQRGWAQVVQTFTDESDLSLYEYLQLFDKVANLANRPAGMKDKLAALARSLPHRFSEELATTRAGHVKWSKVEEVSGIKGRKLMLSALETLGSSSEFLDARTNYELVINLTCLLSITEAQKLFDQVETNSQYLIDDTAPDRTWKTELHPPEATATCVAGFLWSALGDIDEAIRWKAAHSVRILIQLGCHSELLQLVHFAQGANVQAFTDERLVFYRDDAMLWLLLALDRTAREHINIVELFFPLFTDLALTEKYHQLMIRHLESILQALREKATTKIARASAEILAGRMWAPLPPNVVDYSDREHHNRSKFDGPTTDYKFDYDFRNDCMKPLADCFGIDPWEIENRASTAIKNECGERFNGAHQEDARWTEGIFRQGETLSRYRDFPRIHTLDSYLAFHSLMRVAGELATRVPSYQDPESHEDEFTQWCNQYDLTRKDGRWLSDRRDPTPADQRSLRPKSYDKDRWRWSVQSGDFAEYLGATGADRFRIWEESDQAEHDRSQSVTIRSAFVQPDRANALVMALQTVASRMDFRIPSAGDSLEFDQDGYVLKGWVQDPHGEAGLDQSDEFSGGVSFPPPSPSTEVQRALVLSSDLDFREWTRQNGDQVSSLLVTSWNDQGRPQNGRNIGSKGVRIEIDQTALDDLLDSFGLDLIVEVSIDRATYDYSGRNKDYADDEIGYIDDYFKIFHYKRHIGWVDIHGPLRTG